MAETDIYLRKMRKCSETNDIAASKEEGDMNRRVEIWTVQEEYMVFNNVILAGPSDKEQFFCINRGAKMDYIPAVDIRRVTVTTYEKLDSYGARGRNKR